MDAGLFQVTNWVCGTQVHPAVQEQGSLFTGDCWPCQAIRLLMSICRYTHENVKTRIKNMGINMTAADRLSQKYTNDALCVWWSIRYQSSFRLGGIYSHTIRLYNTHSNIRIIYRRWTSNKRSIQPCSSSSFSICLTVWKHKQRQ